MRINLDRLCKLAGVSSSNKVLSEASNRSYHDDPSVQAADDPEFRFGKNQLSEKKVKEMMGHGHMGDMGEMGGMYEEEVEEGMGHSYHEGMYEEEDMDETMYEAKEKDKKKMKEKEDLDEMIEVDEAMLVQEIRRAKKMMAEARQRKLNESKKRESLQETQLRKMIAEEIDGVFKDLNLTSGWVYGKKQPTNRTRGAVNTAFPGIGFRNSK